MKLTKTVLVLGLALAALSGAQAQQKAGAGAFQSRMREIFAQMNLAVDQQEKIKDFFMQQREKMGDVLKDANLSREEKASKLKETMKDFDGKLKEILTADQYAEWEKKRGELQQLGQGGAGGGNVMERLKQSAQELGLSDDQKSKLKDLFQNGGGKFREILTDQNLSREEKRTKMQEAEKELEPKLKEIFTPEQWEKWQKKRDEQRSQAGGAAAPKEN